jgi:hypothetical protein
MSDAHVGLPSRHRVAVVYACTRASQTHEMERQHLHVIHRRKINTGPPSCAFPRSDHSSSSLAFSTVRLCLGSRHSKESPYSKLLLTTYSSASVVVSASFLLLQRLPSVDSILDYLQPPIQTQQPSTTHHGVSTYVPLVHMPHHTTDKTQSKSAQSSPTC